MRSKAAQLNRRDAMNAEADQRAKRLERVELAPAFEALQPYNSASKLGPLQTLRAVRRSFGATVSKRAGKPSFSKSVCRVKAAGNPAAATGRGSEAAFAGIGGPSNLPACCYGAGMEGLRCYYGILRGSPLWLCPALRQTPLPRGSEPPLGSSFRILPSSFCLPLANRPAVHPDGPGPRWSLRRVGSQ
jgi:hypothetical protein